MSLKRSAIHLGAMILALSATAVVAQTEPVHTPATQANAQHDGEHGPWHDGNGARQQGPHHQMAKRLHHMMKMVHATEDQRHQILLIAENTRHKMAVELAEIPKDAKLTRRTTYEKYMTQARADIRAVLTPEQRATLDEQMAKHQQRGKQG